MPRVTTQGHGLVTYDTNGKGRTFGTFGSGGTPPDKLKLSSAHQEKNTLLASTIGPREMG